MLDAFMESTATTVKLIFCVLQMLIIQMLHFAFLLKEHHIIDIMGMIEGK